jgi:uncharacterized YceG family protein
VSPDRTPEEREAARLEREAKRAAKQGTPPPERPKPPPPKRPQKPPPPPPPEAAPEPVAEPVAQPTQPLERPLEPQRPRADAGAHRAAKAREILHRRREARKGEKKPGRGRRRVIPLAIVGIVVAALGWLLLSLFQPLKGDGDGSVRVTIPRGSGVHDIAQILEDKGVVNSAFFFEARARIAGRGGELKAGSFQLREGMSHISALDLLEKGAPDDVVKVTVPEGRSRREVKRALPGGLKGDYVVQSRRSSLLNPRSYGAKRAPNLEGFLFPASYELKRGRPVKQLVEQQLNEFKREFRKVDLRQAKRKNLTAYDVLTIASMVDREAQLPRERRVIASVIYNRLREGIPLGIDATVRFATNNWTRPLTQSQLSTSSPYNTRSRKGLPPGPIGSPGLAAIRAAANPRKTGYLFYVVKPGKCGEHDFSETDAEFQRDVDRYNRERERRGGKSPTNC